MATIGDLVDRINRLGSGRTRALSGIGVGKVRAVKRLRPGVVAGNNNGSEQSGLPGRCSRGPAAISRCRHRARPAGLAADAPTLRAHRCPGGGAPVEGWWLGPGQGNKLRWVPVPPDAMARLDA